MMRESILTGETDIYFLAIWLLCSGAAAWKNIVRKRRFLYVAGLPAKATPAAARRR